MGGSLPKLIIGTRLSALARQQTAWVVAALRAAWPELALEVRDFHTAGDRDQTHTLPEIGGKGLFTAEIETALAAGEVHLAVHSLKDLPIMVDGESGLCLGATPARADPRDVLISRHNAPLAALPARPRIGTCSPRRAVQILALRPDAQIVPLRGNVDTRLRKAATDAYDAIVLAAAGLTRLGLQDQVTEWLPISAVLPAPGQAALALQCRADDKTTIDLLRPLHDPITWAAVTAERAFLAALGGGCAAPVAAYAETAGRLGLWLCGMVAAPPSMICDQAPIQSGELPEGQRIRIVHVSANGPLDMPEALGRRAAQDALAQGARELLPAAQ